MAKQSQLVSDVLARARHSKPGFRTWFERLPADAQAELEAVRRAFDPSVYKKRAYAIAVIEVAQERGWKTAGIQGVVAWLNAKH